MKSIKTRSPLLGEMPVVRRELSSAVLLRRRTIIGIVVAILAGLLLILYLDINIFLLYPLYWIHDNLYLPLKAYTYTCCLPLSRWFWFTFAVFVIVAVVCWMFDIAPLRYPHTLIWRRMVRAIPFHGQLLIFIRLFTQLSNGIVRPYLARLIAFSEWEQIRYEIWQAGSQATPAQYDRLLQILEFSIKLEPYIRKTDQRYDELLLRWHYTFLLITSTPPQRLTNYGDKLRYQFQQIKTHLEAVDETALPVIVPSSTPRQSVETLWQRLITWRKAVQQNWYERTGRWLQRLNPEPADDRVILTTTVQVKPGVEVWRVRTLRWLRQGRASIHHATGYWAERLEIDPEDEWDREDASAANSLQSYRDQLKTRLKPVQQLLVRILKDLHHLSVVPPQPAIPTPMPEPATTHVVRRTVRFERARHVLYDQVQWLHNALVIEEIETDLPTQTETFSQSNSDTPRYADILREHWQSLLLTLRERLLILTGEWHQRFESAEAPEEVHVSERVPAQLKPTIKRVISWRYPLQHSIHARLGWLKTHLEGRVSTETVDEMEHDIYSSQAHATSSVDADLLQICEDLWALIAYVPITEGKMTQRIMLAGANPLAEKSTEASVFVYQLLARIVQRLDQHLQDLAAVITAAQYWLQDQSELLELEHEKQKYANYEQRKHEEHLASKQRIAALLPPEPANSCLSYAVMGQLLFQLMAHLALMTQDDVYLNRYLDLHSSLCLLLDALPDTVLQSWHKVISFSVQSDDARMAYPIELYEIVAQLNQQNRDQQYKEMVSQDVPIDDIIATEQLIRYETLLQQVGQLHNTGTIR